MFVTLYGAIAYISWHCRIKPSFFVAAAGYALCNYFFLDPRGAAESLSDFLEMTENEIRVVHNGFTALETASQFCPQVILRGIGLPDIHGFEVASRIRIQNWGEAPKIYAITGWEQESYQFKSNAAGFDAHFVKTVDPEKILELLNTSKGLKE